MVNSQEWWDGSEIEGVSPGKKLPVPAQEFSEAELYRVPDRLSAGWIEKQLPRSVWKDNRSKLNPHVIASMCDDARKGLSKRAIMARAGFGLQTWNQWEHKAADDSPVYALWYMCMIHSISSVEEELIGTIRDATENDWKAAKWLLERINKEEYSDAPAGVNIHLNKTENQTTINTITDEDSLAIAAILKEIGAVPDAEIIEGEVEGE